MNAVLQLATEDTDALEKQKAKTERWKQWFESAMVMIDHVPAKVLWLNADDDFKITYANSAAKKGLARMQKILAVDPDELYGVSAEFIFKAAGQSMPDLGDPEALPYNARLEIGDETIDVTIEAVMDQKSVYCGAMLNWRVTTQRLRIASEFENQILSLTEHMQEATDELEVSSDKLIRTEEETRNTADAMAKSNGAVEAAIERAATFLDELVTAVEAMSETQAESDQLMERITSQANTSEQRIVSLEKGATEIRDVAALINEIAQQTNLLALNAAVEAARAGDSGRGFAVVAQEIKALSDKTTDATKRIDDRIGNIQSATTGAIEAISGIAISSDSFAKLRPRSELAVEQHNLAVDKMASSIKGASRAIEDATRMTVDLCAAAMNAEGIAGEMHNKILHVNSDCDDLRLQVDRFLAIIK